MKAKVAYELLPRLTELNDGVEHLKLDDNSMSQLASDDTPNEPTVIPSYTIGDAISTTDLM
jgi:hypothetical protein